MLPSVVGVMVVVASPRSVDLFKMMIFERAHFVATTPKPRSSKAVALGLKDHIV